MNKFIYRILAIALYIYNNRRDTHKLCLAYTKDSLICIIVFKYESYIYIYIYIYIYSNGRTILLPLEFCMRFIVYCLVKYIYYN